MTRTVWITGAGSGIGAAMAIAFAKAGDRVVLTGRSEDKLLDVARSLPAGADHLVLPGDVADREGMVLAAEKNY